MIKEQSFVLTFLRSSMVNNEGNMIFYDLYSDLPVEKK